MTPGEPPGSRGRPDRDAVDSELRSRFPTLLNALPPAALAVLEGGRVARLEPGDLIFQEGVPVATVPLVMRGRVRVFKLSETGNEITLYEIHPGETCVLAASAAVSGRSYSAFAVADTAVTAWLVPARDFSELFASYVPFRTFFFELLGERLAVMMSLVEEIAFRKVDARLASYLLERFHESGEIHETHEQIATHLGTAREVVSRLLSDFARRHLVDTGRARISVIDSAGLSAVASQHQTRP